MPRSKKSNRKSFSGSKIFEWQECEKCGCVLNSRYFQEHQEHWGMHPPEMKRHILNQLSTQSSETQGFFIGEKFIAPIADETPETAEESKWLPRTMILLHPVVMQRLNLRRTDRVILFNRLNERIVACVWPTSLARIGYIALHREAHESFSLNTKEWITLEAHRAPKLSAASIILKPLKYFEIDDADLLKVYICKGQDQKCIAEGDKLVTSFMRLDYEFVVTKITEKVSQDDSSFSLDSTVDFGNVTLNDSQSFNLSRIERSMRDLTICDKRELDSTYEFDSQYKMAVDHVPDSDTDGLPKFYSISYDTKFIFDDENVTKSTPEIDWTFDSIGGLTDQKLKLRNLLKIKFDSNINLGNFTGILLHGLHGTGKTKLVQTAAAASHYHFITVHPSDVFTKYGQARKHLDQVFRKAKQNSPSIIFFNIFELIGSKQTKFLNDAELLDTKRYLIQLMDDLYINQEKVIVLAEANKIDEIDTDFLRQGRFDEQIKFTLPSENERQDILTVMLRKVHHNLTKGDISIIATQAYAFVGSDLEMLCSYAKLNARKAKREIVTFDDLKLALGNFSLSGMRGLQLKVPKVFWSDIAIKDETRDALERIITWPTKYPHLFKNSALMVSRNALLYGPPGCSKTLIAKALATESELNFIAVKSSELISKYFGDSEHAISNLFERARSTAPSIIFFDEFDGLAMKNTNSALEMDTASMKIRSQLAIEFDKTKPSHNVVILAATNRPDLIDDAFLSSARLGTKIYIPIPDASIRSQIFKITFRKMPIHDDVNVDELVSKTEQFSGAEIVQLCQNAGIAALREYGEELGQIKMNHFHRVLRATKPKISDALITHNELYYHKTTTQSCLAYM